MGRGSQQTFFQRRHTDGQQVHGKVLSITNHQGNANQNHSEIAPHTFRTAIIKKMRNNKYWQGYREKGIIVHCWWECKLVQPLQKTVWRFLKKIKNRTTIRPRNFTSGYLSEGKEITASKRYLHSYLHCSIFYNSQDMETRWMNG